VTFARSRLGREFRRPALAVPSLHMNPESQVEVRALQAIREARRVRAELQEALFLAAQTMQRVLSERQPSEGEAR
jgi:hypothetical protein